MSKARSARRRLRPANRRRAHFRQGRSDGDDFELIFAKRLKGALQFFLAGFENVVAVDGAQFGAAHPELAHGRRGRGDIRRKHVGNSADVESLHYSFIRSSLR